jgi:drug/metabolite transporter (DMT)-like permease
MSRFFNNAPLLLILTTAMWGGNIVLGRAFAADLPPATLALIRWSGAFLLSLPLAWPHWRGDADAVRRHWVILTVLAVSGIGLYNTLFYVGLRFSPALNGLLMQSSAPLITALWTFLLFKERPSGVQALGIVVSLIGVLVILSRADLAVLRALQFGIGDLWFLVAMVVYCLYSAAMRLKPAIHWTTFLCVTLGIGALVQVPFIGLEEFYGVARHFSATGLVAIAYIIVGPAFLAYIFFNRAIELIGANRTASAFHLVPLFGSGMAIVFLGEQLKVYHLVGYPLIMVGVALAMLSKR